MVWAIVVAAGCGHGPTTAPPTADDAMRAIVIDAAPATPDRHAMCLAAIARGDRKVDCAFAGLDAVPAIGAGVVDLDLTGNRIVDVAGLGGRATWSACASMATRSRG